jgi:hypothetical protein
MPRSKTQEWMPDRNITLRAALYYLFNCCLSTNDVNKIFSRRSKLFSSKASPRPSFFSILLRKKRIHRGLRFASGGIIMASAACPKIFFCSWGGKPTRNSKTNNAGIKVGDRSPTPPVRIQRKQPETESRTYQ